MLEFTVDPRVLKFKSATAKDHSLYISLVVFQLQVHLNYDLIPHIH